MKCPDGYIICSLLNSMDYLEPEIQSCVICYKDVRTSDKDQYFIINDKESSYYQDSICIECAQSVITEWLERWAYYR